MKKILNLFAILLMMALPVMTSCSKDDDGPSGGNGSSELSGTTWTVISDAGGDFTGVTMTFKNNGDVVFSGSSYADWTYAKWDYSDGVLRIVLGQGEPDDYIEGYFDIDGTSAYFNYDWYDYDTEYRESGPYFMELVKKSSGSGGTTGGSSSSLVGTWYAESSSSFAGYLGEIIVLASDGTWKSYYNEENYYDNEYTYGTWTYSGSKLTAIGLGTVYNGVKYPFDVDDIETFTFTITNQTSTTISGTAYFVEDDYEDSFSFILTKAPSSGDSGSVEGGSSATISKDSIVGVWYEGEDGDIDSVNVFNSDNTFKIFDSLRDFYSDNNYSYGTFTLSGDTMTLVVTKYYQDGTFYNQPAQTLKIKINSVGLDRMVISYVSDDFGLNPEFYTTVFYRL